MYILIVVFKFILYEKCREFIGWGGNDCMWVVRFFGEMSLF